MSEQAETRACRKCGEVKPLKKFVLYAKDKRKHICYTCDLVRRKQKPDYREKQHALRRNWEKKHPGYYQQRNAEYAKRNARDDFQCPDFKAYPRCKTRKPSDHFYRNKASFDGLAAYCTSCYRRAYL